MQLPHAVGSKITVPAHDYALKRAVEARGFWPESGDGRQYVMRRDFPDGALVTHR